MLTQKTRVNQENKDGYQKSVGGKITELNQLVAKAYPDTLQGELPKPGDWNEASRDNYVRSLLIVCQEHPGYYEKIVHGLRCKIFDEFVTKEQAVSRTKVCAASGPFSLVMDALVEAVYG